MADAGQRDLPVFVAAIVALVASSSLVHAIDFYEIQIYSTETAPEHRLTLELHSNSVTAATGAEAKANLRPYEIHETLEATYGITPHIEIGQYLCTGKLESGNYEYAGSRTKVHMGFGDPEKWPALGVNLELDYMRQAARRESAELRASSDLRKALPPPDGGGEPGARQVIQRAGHPRWRYPRPAGARQL
jgi:hypothetical protein